MVFGNRMSNCSPYDSIVLLGQVLSTGCMYRLKYIQKECIYVEHLAPSEIKETFSATAFPCSSQMQITVLFH